jgi:hypothetical protein
MLSHTPNLSITIVFILVPICSLLQSPENDVDLGATESWRKATRVCATCRVLNTNQRKRILRLDMISPFICCDASDKHEAK